MSSNPETGGANADSLQGQDAAPIQQIVREEWAATRIQTAFRGFLVFSMDIYVLNTQLLFFIGLSSC